MNKILKASAGTGKTYRLSLEFVTALLEGQNFEEIIVMTFTRKATAEIRERIIEHIEDIIKLGEYSQVFASLKKVNPQIKLNTRRLADTYNQILINKDKLNIYTIDSFTNKIFKQAVAPYLGIYSYQIIDEDKNSEIIEQVFKEMLDNPADFALMEKFLTDNPERKIEKYLNLIGDMLKNRWKFLLIEHETRQPEDISQLTFLLDQSLTLLESIAEAKGKEFNGDFFIKDFKILMTEYQQLESRTAREDKIITNYQLFFKNSFWNGSKTRGKKVAHLIEDLEVKYEDFLRQLAGYIYNTEMIPYEEEIFKFSSRIFEIYDQLKFKDKVFTHTDISNYTYQYFYVTDLNLLDGNLVSDYFFELLGTEVKTLFIDEFQDTSILQWKILRPLIDRCEEVITVGDEKQSIYGWRGGEKELFSNLDNIIAGKSESLLTCYRSQQEIIKFVNRFFSNLDLDWTYKEVTNLPDKDKGFVEIVIGGESARTNTNTKSFQKLTQENQEKIIALNDQIIPNLPEEIARRIKELPTYNNVGVLARSNKDLGKIASELDKLGIPYIMDSRDSLLEHVAVKPLYFLLSYLNYHDYFQLLQFLRSELVGINNTALKYLLRNKGLIEDFMEGKKQEIAYLDLQLILAEIKGLKQLDYQDLTSYLIEETGIIDNYQENSGALKNIYYFFKLMRRFSCLADFMGYLKENQESEELKQVGVKEDQAVNLMTIHKAKGLSFQTEFFYWSPATGNGGSSDRMELYLSFDEKYQRVDDYLLTSSRFNKLFGYLDINFAEEQAEKELMEEINNVYVALTRPENNLFFFIEAPRKLMPAGERFWEGSSYQFYEEAVLSSAGVLSLVELVEGKQLGQLMLPEIIKAQADIELPPLNKYFHPPALDPDLIENNNLKKDFNMNLKKEIARIDGLAIHYYLEHIKYDTPQERDYAYKMVTARYGNILGPVQISKIIERVNNFIDNHPEYFAKSWQVFTEYQLNQGEDRYRIDRLLVNQAEKEMIILDYKSGITKEESQLAKYREIINEHLESDFRIRTEFLEI